MTAKYGSREIVWAKIEPYPWWPGKIINIHIQEEEIVYKILFFADPTYAYLKEQQIKEFLHFDRNANSQCAQQSRLNRAIKMADQAYGRLNNNGESADALGQRRASTKTEKQSCATTLRQPQQMTIEPVEEQNAPEMEQQPQMLQEQEQIKQESTPIDQPILNFEEITKDNILEILAKRVRNPHQFEYNYDNRKKIIKHTGELKRTLLQRYNLTMIDQEQNQLQSQPKRQPKGKLRCRINRKKNHILHMPHLKQKCIKRLYTLARRSTEGECSLDLKEFATNIVRRISQLSDQNQLKYKSLYVTLLRSLEPAKARGFEERMSDFGLYLDRFQSEKHEDQEGSKMTQISVLQP